ncbi:MAG TPA: DUF3054 domain-containing protein [Acidimicrobiia bacterium]|nr:DUF3054 domain-containing protein [Acidimicrobiia bacterium]
MTTVERPNPAPVRPRLRPWVAPAVDLAVVVAFVAIGRRSHGEANDASGFATTLWPFVAGLTLATLATRLFVAPLDWRRAVPAWLATVAVGLALRIGAGGREFKVSFAIVATAFLGLFLLGWRAAVLAIARRRQPRATAAQKSANAST